MGSVNIWSNGGYPRFDILHTHTEYFLETFLNPPIFIIAVCAVFLADMRFPISHPFGFYFLKLKTNFQTTTRLDSPEFCFSSCFFWFLFESNDALRRPTCASPFQAHLLPYPRVFFLLRSFCSTCGASGHPATPFTTDRWWSQLVQWTDLWLSHRLHSWFDSFWRGKKMYSLRPTTQSFAFTNLAFFYIFRVLYFSVRKIAVQQFELGIKVLFNQSNRFDQTMDAIATNDWQTGVSFVVHLSNLIFLLFFRCCLDWLRFAAGLVFDFCLPCRNRQHRFKRTRQSNETFKVQFRFYAKTVHTYATVAGLHSAHARTRTPSTFPLRLLQFLFRSTLTDSFCTCRNPSRLPLLHRLITCCPFWEQFFVVDACCSDQQRERERERFMHHPWTRTRNAWSPKWNQSAKCCAWLITWIELDRQFSFFLSLVAIRA